MTSSYPMSGLHFFSVEGKNEKKETNKSIPLQKNKTYEIP